MVDVDKQLHTEETMKEIATSLDEAIENSIGKNMGFILIIFKFGKPGLTNYISNAQRKDIIIGLRESADVLEQNKDIPVIKGSVH